MRKVLVAVAAFVLSAVLGLLLLVMGDVLVALPQLARQRASGIGAVAGGVSTGIGLLVPLLFGTLGAVLTLHHFARRKSLDAPALPTNAPQMGYWTAMPTQRKPLIAANWKMFKTPAEAVAFTKTFIPLVSGNKTTEIVLCPSPTALAQVVEATAHDRIHVAAQDMHWLDQGAYTGETSPLVLKALGVTHVLIGHSERRQYFNETDETVHLKLRSALAHGLVPIVCVGEQLAEREAGETAAVLDRQVAAALTGIDPAAATPLVIAYEPVWAIGTGRTATPEIADEAHQIIRAQIAASLSDELAASTRILYGGSVKPDNAASLCCLADIDGALVGGASLDPHSFAQIVANSAG